MKNEENFTKSNYISLSFKFSIIKLNKLFFFVYLFDFFSYND